MKKKQHATATSKAARLGISRTTLYKWKTAGAPIEKGEAAILEWAINEQRGGRDSDEVKAARVDVLKETARKLKTANDLKSGEVIELSKAMQEAKDGMAIVWAGLDRIANELPPRLTGVTVTESARVIRMHVEGIKQAFRSAFAELEGESLDPSANLRAAEAIINRHVSEVLSKKAFDEKAAHWWSEFMDYKRRTEAERMEQRRAWCRERAAAGLPVPDASDEELKQVEGLKRL